MIISNKLLQPNVKCNHSNNLFLYNSSSCMDLLLDIDFENETKDVPILPQF